MEKKRCWGDGDTLMEKYHDDEWGVPVADDNKLFERFVLEMFQAGLSWRTILHKREAFRMVFKNFSIKKIAKFNDDDIKRMLNDKSIIRNELKIKSVVHNARAIIELRKNFGSFNLWLESLDLNKKDVDKQFKAHFKFVGPEIVKSFLQSIGKVETYHSKNCWKYKHV